MSLSTDYADDAFLTLWRPNLGIYHKGPELLVTNKPKRGEFPSSIRYLPHLCNDLARGMFSLWSHPDSAKNQ